MTATIDPRIQARRVEVLRDEGRRRRRRLVVALVLVVVIVVTVAITQSAALDVDEIGIEGADRTSVEEIADASGVSRGDLMLSLDLGEARQSIAALPWIHEVRSTRDWPGSVTFAVTERQPASQVLAEHGWATVDLEGRVLAVQPSAAPDLAIVGNVVAGEAGSWIPTDSLPAVEVGATLPTSLQAALTELTVDEIYGVVAGLRSGGLVIWGAPEGSEDKIVALQTMLAQVDLRCLDRLDISVPNAPVLTRVPGCT